MTHLSFCHALPSHLPEVLADPDLAVPEVDAISELTFLDAVASAELADLASATPRSGVGSAPNIKERGMA